MFTIFIPILMLSLLCETQGITYPADKCEEHEVYNACPAYCTFDEGCGSYISGFIQDCAAPPEEYPCYPRCDCEKGYLRIDGTCQLPVKCCDDPNTQVVNCPAPCDKTCDGSNTADCDSSSTRACRCLVGYVRSENGKCILKADCR